jgi:hypothetical protein
MATLTPAAPIAVTFFADYAAAEKRQRVVALDELAALIRDTAAPSKAELPWLKLARFGNARTAHNSLRHDRNVIAITGIEADYDGESIGFDVAIEAVEKAGLLAIVYTSPSYTPERPRWRILAPTSCEYPPADRARLLGRLNGLYRGIFARESWTLSQAYYFGRIGAAVAHHVELVDGHPIDRLDELDRISLGPAAGNESRSRSEIGDRVDGRDDAELVRRIVTGDGYHPELTALAARYIGRGMDPRAAAETLHGFMLSHLPETRDDRWRDRLASIPAIVRSAAGKFAPEAQRRKALAKFTHRLVRRPTTTGAEIKSAILAEAERLGIAAGAALAIGAGIVRDHEAQRHARRH